ncbi:MAG TPA: cysteine desulfurase family protein [Candidatus Cybelea sp.]|nr:cysteine desulfurase family protein [Candidatus Cybelea sp.]
MAATIAYLDYNATAPIREAAARAVVEAMEVGGNPSSVHASGRRARKIVEAARGQVATLVGAKPMEVIFTSGGTEANNLALNALPFRRLIVSAIEHDSILAAAAATDADFVAVPVDRDGVLDLAALEAALAGCEGPVLVSVMLANNETGVLQPVREAAGLAREHGALVHCDATQAVGRIAVDMVELGADMLTLSAHKLGGPQGVGALIVREGLDVQPRQHGGGQEFGRRAGTENVPGIAGFGAAAIIALDEVARAGKIAALRDGLERQIKRSVPAALIWGEAVPRLPNTCCIGLAGVPSETQVMALDLAGVAVSAGAACSSGKVRPSHVLRAMGASPDAAASSIRVSLGAASTAADTERFLTAWIGLYARANRHGSAHAPAARRA